MEIDVSCPTLILCGEKDRPAIKQASEHFAKTIPGAQLTYIKNRPSSKRTQPQRFSSESYGFFQQIKLKDEINHANQGHGQTTYKKGLCNRYLLFFKH